MQKVKELASRLKRCERTVYRWIAEGMDIEDEQSIRTFSIGKELRKTNVKRAKERLEALGVSGVSNGSGISPMRSREQDPLFDDLPPAGRKGAAAALERLENAEERAHVRLQVALQQSNNQFLVRELADYWLKCSETLRRLDLAVEMARRDSEEQLPKKLAEDLALFISEWLRIAFFQFLSSEGPTLMGIKQFGEWKKYALERFHGILELTVKSSMQTKSQIPEWAAAKVREAWNIG